MTSLGELEGVLKKKNKNETADRQVKSEMLGVKGGATLGAQGRGERGKRAGEGHGFQLGAFNVSESRGES